MIMRLIKFFNSLLIINIAHYTVVNKKTPPAISLLTGKFIPPFSKGALQSAVDD